MKTIHPISASIVIRKPCTVLKNQGNKSSSTLTQWESQ